MSMKMKTFGGEHLNTACERAIEMANLKNVSVEFEFNGTSVIVQPSETAEIVAARWSKDSEEAHQKYINSQEYKDAEAKREQELQEKMTAQMIETASSEKELRETPDKHPYTIEQLTQYVTSLVKREHDYGTCVYAMSLAAVAAFNYVAHELGVTGFQASCADLDILRHTRMLKCPFMIVKAEDMLYPQYNILEKVNEALENWQPWAKEEAKKKLQDTQHVHPDVLARWEQLAK